MNIFEGKNILIIEDNLDCAELLIEILSITRAKLLIARDGNEGLDLFVAQPIDIVLLDISLPGINGLKLLSMMGKIKKDVPVIVQSAYAYAEDVKAAILAGGKDYLTKPIDNKKLFQVLLKYLIS